VGNVCVLSTDCYAPWASDPLDGVTSDAQTSYLDLSPGSFATSKLQNAG